MTQDDIIRMAQKAGVTEEEFGLGVSWGDLERFATLVEAAAIDKAHKSFCAELRQMHDAYALSSHPGVLRTRGKTK